MTEHLPESTLQSLGALDGSLAERIRKGKLNLVDVVRVLVPDVPETALAEYVVPLPAEITAKAKAALDSLPQVFGAVVPTERRLLEEKELAAIFAEREVCDTILNLVKDRKEKGIRTTILNHIDTWLESELTPEELAELDRDKDGHYYFATKVDVPETGKAFSWEITDGQPVLSPDLLAELDANGEIDHDLYLSITEPVRVINEQKLLLAMSKQPEAVLEAIKAASVAGSKKGSLYVRNA